jgi:hypothetical protein
MGSLKACVFTSYMLSTVMCNCPHRFRLFSGELFELPGRPHVCYSLRDYGSDIYDSVATGAKCAREDFGFLFKAFETGQTPPHRLKKDAAMDVAPTIHQYLDWTITSTSPPVRAGPHCMCVLACAPVDAV